ncbi:MAG: hypothetical protein ACOYN3_05805 [Acidimicrobiia bacterium]
MKMRLGTAVILVLSTVLVACGGSKKASQPESEFSGNPVTVQQELLNQTTDEGVLPKDAALQLFVMQYGPLPGVNPVKGNLGEPTEGTLAIRSVVRYWDELTEAQRIAITEYIDRPGFDPRSSASPTSSAPPTTGKPGRSRRTDAAAAAPYVASANAVMPYLERHFGALGVPLQVNTRTRCVRVPSTRSCALADAVVWDGKCDINVYPNQFPAPSGPSITLAHEIFHCYQQQWNGGVLSETRNWVQEGGAEWVGMTINAEAGGPEDTTVRSNFTWYYATPTRPLFSRTYDAVGFFALAQQSGVDVMARMRAVVVAGSNRASFDALGLPLGEGFSSDWATTQRSESSWGTRWALRGLGVPTITRTLAVSYRAIGNGASAALASVPYATAQGAYNLRADLTRITSAPPSAGYLHVSTQERTLAAVRDQIWCTSDDLSRCRCPEGTRQAGREFPPMTPGETVVALGAGTAAGSMQIQGVSLEDECGRAGRCPIGSFQLTSNPTGRPFTVTSGGIGQIITVAPDGQLVQSFDQFETMVGTNRGASFTISARGRITATIVIPAGVQNPTGMRIQNPDGSGLTGSGEFVFPDGTRVEITGADFQAFLSGLTSPENTATLNCENADTLTATAGGIVETYRRIGS